MKLELKHLALYLPYGLKIKVVNGFYKYDIMTLCDKGGLSNVAISTVIDDYEEFKPILRPLSDLTKEIEHNGEKFVPIDVITNGLNGYEKTLIINQCVIPDQLPYYVVKCLHEWHFDTFGLIENNLAVDINTLTK